MVYRFRRLAAGLGLALLSSCGRSDVGSGKKTFNGLGVPRRDSSGIWNGSAVAYVVFFCSFSMHPWPALSLGLLTWFGGLHHQDGQGPGRLHVALQRVGKGCACG